MEQENTVISSDWHLSHKNILTYNPEFRKYPTVEEMAQAIIDNANSVCTEKDNLILAGDIGWHHRTLLEALPKLRAGKISIVSGNHDLTHPIHKNKYEKAAMEVMSICDRVVFIGTELEVRIGIFTVLISHFPYGTAKSDFQKYRPNVKGDHHFLLHGHSHSSPKTRYDRDNDSLDIGWDAWGRVVTFTEIEDFIHEHYESYFQNRYYQS